MTLLLVQGIDTSERDAILTRQGSCDEGEAVPRMI
jgi:hypothetical protein